MMTNPPTEWNVEQENRTPRVYIGIDPGASGGMAALWSDGIGNSSIALSATTLSQRARLLRQYSKEDVKAHAFLERVQGYIPKKGREDYSGNRQPASRMGELLRSAGQMEGILVALGIPYFHYFPQRWQTGLGLETKGDRTDTEWKRYLKGIAQEMFPSIKVTNAIADALLMAEYCMRQFEQSPRDKSVLAAPIVNHYRSKEFNS